MWLDVAIKGHLKLDDDLVESFKVQDITDQIRGFLDEGQDFTVTVQKNTRLSRQEEEAKAAASGELDLEPAAETE